jgi:hypothetical protein
VKERQKDLAFGVPVDLFLMRELRWTPAQVASVPNRTVMELLALFRLEAERAR